MMESCNFLSAEMQTIMVPMVIGVVEIIKRTNIIKNSAWFTPISMVVGIIVAATYAYQQGQFPDNLKEYINLGLGGALSGLAGSGIYRGIKVYKTGDDNGSSNQETGKSTDAK